MTKIVVFTGAGMSAESGIQTFRDSGGLWEGHNVQDVATPQAWAKNPALVLKFYNERRRNIKQAQPNFAHLALSNLENEYDVQIITQNIDDLHERAGSSKVLHLHGEIFKMRSENNEGLLSDIDGDIQLGDLASDGAQFRPHIVWFGEEVPMMEMAIAFTKQAHLFVVIGTSLVVYPAASLLQFLETLTPLIVLDKKIPVISHHNLHKISKPATEGVDDLLKLIRTLI